MPVDPETAQRLVGDPEFQALPPTEQLRTFRGYLAQSEPEFGQFNELQQQDAAKQIMEQYAPGFGDRLLAGAAAAAEYVPVIGGAIRGYQADEIRPLTNIVTLGYQPETQLGRAAAEAGRDIVELLASGGVARLALGPATQVAGRLLGGEAVAAGVGRALGATASGAAERIAVQAGQRAISERLLARAGSEAIGGLVFGGTNAIERGIATGEVAPLEDFVYTPIGAAALGMAFMGLGGVMQKFGRERGEAAFQHLRSLAPERAQQIQGEAGILVDAITRAAPRGSRITTEQAADLAFRAATEPLEQAEADIVKRALKLRAEVFDTEVGRQVLRLQRDRLLQPVVQVAEGQPLRVQFDVIDPESGFPGVRPGTTVGEKAPLELVDAGEIATLRRAIESKRVVLEAVSGDERQLAALGLRPEPPAQPGAPVRPVAPTAEGAPFLRQPSSGLVGPRGEALPGLPAVIEPTREQLAMRALRNEAALPPGRSLDEVRATPDYSLARTEVEWDARLRGEPMTPAEADARAMESLGFRRDEAGQVVHPNADLVNPEVRLREPVGVRLDAPAPDDKVMAGVRSSAATLPKPPVGSEIPVEVSGGGRAMGQVVQNGADGRTTVEFEGGRRATGRPTAYGLDIPAAVLRPPARVPLTPELTRQVGDVQAQLATGNVLRLNAKATGGDAGVFDVMANDGVETILRRRGTTEPIVVPTEGVVSAVTAGDATLGRLPTESVEQFVESTGRELAENAPQRADFLRSAERYRDTVRKLRTVDELAAQQAPTTLAVEPKATAKAREQKWFDFVRDDEAQAKGWSELVRGCPK